MTDWINHGEKTVLETKWFRLAEADVEIPGGRHLNHYVMHQPPAVVVACVNDRDEVLMLWRDRFIHQVHVYELPSGGLGPGEALEDAARRELREETGWEAKTLHHLVTVDPSPGLSTMRHHVYWTDDVEKVEEPRDGFESLKIEWVPLSKTPDLIASGDIRVGNAIAALLMLCRLRGI